MIVVMILSFNIDLLSYLYQVQWMLNHMKKQNPEDLKGCNRGWEENSLKSESERLLTTQVFN